MGRDSNPRRACTLNGFQDRRNRPLCHPSETLFGLILYYFLRIANVKITAPAINIAPDSNWPMVKPQLVKKPI